MVQLRGRFGLFELKIDFGGMALAGADLRAGFVEGEPLLVARPDDRFELLAGEAEPGVGSPGEQVVDEHPAARFEGEVGFFRLVPQHE